MDSQRLVYPKIPSWWIFDDRRFKTGPLTPTFMGPTGPLRQIPWGADNQAELERGWVLSAGSIGELAGKCGMEPSVLAETVRRYNAACADGNDPDFRRPASTMTPLDGPTYYAVRLWPGGPNTQGGPRRNADGQVMRVTGEPIPGLYTAGELGSVYGMLYPSVGGNIAECLAFARGAGRTVRSGRGTWGAALFGRAPRSGMAHRHRLTVIEDATAALVALPPDTPWPEVIYTHQEIHRAIIRWSGNTRLKDAYTLCEQEIEFVVASTRPDYTAERLAELHTHLLDRLRLGGERATRALARDIEIGRRAVHKAAGTLSAR